ncbi:hypothetical protein ACH6EH_06620 [Paenibacillus sp. JSM ZJ436]|uniref:hypothetical protein n=1 Tax=Paenibacillus sp. JSM ZJ436 TaxID=3376190 RepID=UPI0037B5641A
MTKKLSASAINKAHKALDNKKKITVLGEYEVNISLTFKDSDIDKVIFDYLTMFEEAGRNNKIDDEFILGSGALLHTLILGAFTDVPMIPKERDIAKYLEVANVFYNTGIMNAVIEALPERELKKVSDKLDANSKKIGQMIGEYALSSAMAQGENNEDQSQEHEGIRTDNQG